MALIECGECGHSVSDKAASCVKCGAPIDKAEEYQRAGASLTTTQETSKKLKAHMLLSVLMISIGLILIISAGSSSQTEESPLGGLLMFLGFVWFIVTRFRTWWHHG